VVTFALSACEAANFGRGIVAENRTASPLTFELEVDGERRPLTTAIAKPDDSVAILSCGQFGGPSRITAG
jgi:hypothetical protein